ncbi:MAG: hypothetical protein ACTHZZ_04330 [Halomonas sp.]|uniref:hypothetical protein n=1 Tax=Halomonas sp. AOP42-B2-16 TaxID=3457673 RepID=UPI003FBA5A69
MPTDNQNELNSVTDSLNTRTVNMALEGKIPVNELSAEEQQTHAQMLWQSLEDLDGSDVRALQEIQRAGGSVYGIDKQGNIKKAGPLEQLE